MMSCRSISCCGYGKYPEFLLKRDRKLEHLRGQSRSIHAPCGEGCCPQGRSHYMSGSVCQRTQAGGPDDQRQYLWPGRNRGRGRFRCHKLRKVTATLNSSAMRISAAGRGFALLQNDTNTTHGDIHMLNRILSTKRGLL